MTPEEKELAATIEALAVLIPCGTYSETNAGRKHTAAALVRELRRRAWVAPWEGTAALFAELRTRPHVPLDPAARVPPLVDTLAELRRIEGVIVRRYFYDGVTAMQQANLAVASALLREAVQALQAAADGDAEGAGGR